MTTSLVRQQQRRDTAANWTSANPTLADGEIGREKDTKRQKVGDGATPWNGLQYEDQVALVSAAQADAISAAQASAAADATAKASGAQSAAISTSAADATSKASAAQAAAIAAAAADATAKANARVARSGIQSIDLGTLTSGSGSWVACAQGPASLQASLSGGATAATIYFEFSADGVGAIPAFTVTLSVGTPTEAPALDPATSWPFVRMRIGSVTGGSVKGTGTAKTVGANPNATTTLGAIASGNNGAWVSTGLGPLNLQATASGTAATVAFDGSNDQVQGVQIGSAISLTTGALSDGMLLAPESNNFQFVRLRNVSSTGGSVTGTLTARA